MSKISITIGFWNWCKENNLTPTNKRYRAFKAGIEFASKGEVK